MEISKFAERIRYIRLGKDMNLREFGGLIGKSAQFIFDLEQGKNSPSAKTMLEIEQALGIEFSLEDFIKNEKI